MYDGVAANRARTRSEFKQEFYAQTPANRRKPVPYPASMSEMIPFVEWFPREVLLAEGLGIHTLEEVQLYCTPPSTHALSFKSCKAYGNHWRTLPLNSLSDCHGSTYSTFDSGMAGTWNESTVNRRGETITSSVTYVGVLSEIIQLDYGPLPSPVVLFKGKWGDSRTVPKARATVRHGESGLLQADFSSELSRKKKMDYVLPSQVQQVFFYPNVVGAKWRTILHKEPRSIRVYEDYEEVDLTVDVEDNWKTHTDLATEARKKPMVPVVVPEATGSGKRKKRPRP